MPPFTHKTPRARLPAFAGQNHSFLELISSFCFNELVSFLVVNALIRPFTPSFSWKVTLCVWEPKSALNRQSSAPFCGSRALGRHAKGLEEGVGGSVRGRCPAPHPPPPERFWRIPGLSARALPLSVGLERSLRICGFARNHKICLDPQNFFSPARPGPVWKPEKCGSIRVTYTHV